LVGRVDLIALHSKTDATSPFDRSSNASAPYTVLFEQFGFTVDKVVAAAHASLAKVGEITGSTTGN
jgi:hypothetical protein